MGLAVLVGDIGAIESLVSERSDELDLLLWLFQRTFGRQVICWISTRLHENGFTAPLLILVLILLFRRSSTYFRPLIWSRL